MDTLADNGERASGSLLVVSLSFGRKAEPVGEGEGGAGMEKEPIGRRLGFILSEGVGGIEGDGIGGGSSVTGVGGRVIFRVGTDSSVGR